DEADPRVHNAERALIADALEAALLEAKLHHDLALAVACPVIEELGAGGAQGGAGGGLEVLLGHHAPRGTVAQGLHELFALGLELSARLLFALALLELGAAPVDLAALPDGDAEGEIEGGGDVSDVGDGGGPVDVGGAHVFFGAERELLAEE